ncbi:MAG: serine hydrolase [Anaerolineae bacterium]|nr:serine hydrolase [Anaerolineae bacterium]
MLKQSECVFCQIAAGQAPASVVYQDQSVMAFMDLNQPNSGKVLVMPRCHIETIYDLDDDLAAHMMQVATRVARAIRAAIRPDGLNLFQANGRAAQQSVFHLHLHLVPRYQADSILIRWPAHTPPRETLDRLAAQIRASLPERVWTLVDDLMRQYLGRVAPSMALHIAQGGNPAFERAYGHLDPLDAQRPTQPDSVFDLASLTKLFTLTAFLRLATQGRVTVDTPVREVLPRFSGLHPIGGAEDPITKRPIDADAAFRARTVDRDKITFRHLLTHTSGLAAWRAVCGEIEDTAGRAPAEISPELRTARMEKLYDYPFIYPTGEKLVYSDLGLILLGEAVARLAGEPLEQAIRRLVLEPLGIDDQAWFNPLARGVPQDRIVPTEYSTIRDRRLLGEVHDENAAGLAGVAGHAGLFATAQAVATLGQLYLNGGLWNGTKLIDAALIAESIAGQVQFENTRRGLGWVLYDDGAFGHTGYTGTSLRCYPALNLTVALFTNRVYYGRDWEGIFRLRTQAYEAILEALR